ncbi:hypothetical protein FACS189431_5570 [Alphaproteobacteria bacterium]|nr:hypothetical protein FACS189431_5570 [Alphaproteobacteria bacterium]
MQDNNNPFQVDQTPVEAVGPTPAVPDALPTEPVAQPKKKPPVAVDGVSINYDDPNLYASSSQPEPLVATEPIAEPVATDPNVGYPVAPENLTSPVEAPTDGGYTNPLIEDQPAVENPIETVPQLASPDDTAIEITNDKPGMTFKAWQFFLAAGLAVIGIAGTIFFVVEYNQTNASFQETLNQLETYRSQSETGQKAAQQLESLQDTVREQSDKINQLKTDNDNLKKTEDELKKAKEENEKLRTERDDAQKALVNAVTPKP